MRKFCRWFVLPFFTLFVFFGFFDFAEAAISLNASAKAATKTLGTSLTISVPSPGFSAETSLIISATYIDTQASILSVTDSVGNIYALDEASTMGSSLSGNLEVWSAHAIQALGSGSTITITFSKGIRARAAVAANFSGLASTGTRDQKTTASNTGTTVSIGPTLQTIEANELLIAAVGVNGPLGDGLTPGANYTLLNRSGTSGGGPSSNATQNVEYRIVMAQGSYAAGATLATRRPWGGILVTYRAAPPRISISGTVYSDQGVTVTTGTVKLAVNGTTAYSANTNVNGGFVFSNVVTPQSGEVLTLWMDNNSLSRTGVVITRYSGSGNIFGIDMYRNHLILREDDGGPPTRDDLSRCDRATSSGNACNGDQDLFFDLDEGSGVLTLFGSSSLYIFSGAAFSPDGPIVLEGGNVYIASSGILNAENSSLWIGGGNLEINGTFSQGINATTTFLESGALGGSGTISLGSVVLGTSTQGITMIIVGNLFIGQSLVVQDSLYGNTLYAGTSTITFLGGGNPFVLGAGSGFLPGNSTVVYKGTVATEITSLTYYNLRVEPGAYLTVHSFGEGTVAVTNAFVAGDGTNQGIVSASPHDTTITITGDFSIASGTTFEAAPFSSFSLFGDMSVQGGFAGNNGTLILNGTAPQNLNGLPFQLSNLTVANTQMVRVNVADLMIDKNLLILENARLRAPSGIFTIRGEYTNQGRFDHGNGAVRVAGTSRQRFSGIMTGMSNFNTLSVLNTSGADPINDPSVIFTDPMEAALFRITNGLVKLQFATSSTYTFGSIEWQGASLSEPIYLRSVSPNASGPEDQWSLITGASQLVKSVDVQNSFACGGVTIEAGDGSNRDSRNNSCWRFASGYAVSGVLYSHIIDTQIEGGVTPNSILWRGVEPAGTRVKFQFASSNSADGPWNYTGWNGFFCSPIGTYSDSPGKAIEIKAGCHFNERYLRYKVILETDDATVTPLVEEIILNYAR